ncbi:zinc finger domain-containing protein [Streptomyces cadmiisoli]|uniref:zinc finger domain-containing protein n=1 Tax=Streptomyces cadmiisoli TaxID=2184053 RepID=UPI003D759400
MTQPTPRQPVPYRFAAMAILCTWCRARTGQLCTNQRGSKDRRRDVHTTRALDWIRVMSTPCPERICQAPADKPCTLHPNVHQARITAAALPTTTTP